MIDKDEGGSEEQGQADIANELEKAWDEIEAGPVENVSEEPDAAQHDDQPGETLAPVHWSQSDKDAFNALPEELRPLYLKRVKLLESGYNRKFEEVAGARKQIEEFSAMLEGHDPQTIQQTFDTGATVHQLLSPYQQQLAESGLTPVAYVQRLVDVAAHLQADPAGTLNFLAQQYGVNLGAAGPDLSAEHQATLSQYQDAVQRLYAERNDGHAREWAAFTQANPQAAPLQQRIGIELLTNPQKPGESTNEALKRAYESVRWSDPQIRQSLLDAEHKAKDAERQRKADLQKAKAAGRTVKSKSMPGSGRPIPADSWKEELEKQWDKHV